MMPTIRCGNCFRELGDYWPSTTANGVLCEDCFAGWLYAIRQRRAEQQREAERQRTALDARPERATGGSE